MPSPFDQQWWDENEQELYDELLPVLLAALALGWEGGIKALPKNLQGLVNPNDFTAAAAQWAKEYRYQYIKGITETSKKQTQTIMENWIKSGQPLEALELQLASVFGESRAARIAATETTRAFSQGNMAAWESTGFVTGGEWMTAQDERVCPICLEHEGETVGIGDIDAAPPNSSHVGCRCWIQPIVDLDLVQSQVRSILAE